MRCFATIIPLILLGSMLASCSRDFDVTLPEDESKLVVECYLEDGQPLRALVTESTALLDTNMIPPIVVDAVITITHAGQIDTLQPFVYIDSARNRAYNYGSNTTVKADYHSGESYRIDVFDKKGRHASAVTSFMKAVPISGIEPVFNTQGEASLITTFADEQGVKNYYRLLIKRNAHFDSIQQNRFFDDALANAQGNIAVRSGYRYSSGDSVHATLFHISRDYYQFLNTSQNARSALANPFAASGEVVSNITGGLGIFTALSYTQYSIRIP